MASDPYASYNPHEHYNERNEPVYNPYSFTAGQNVHNEYNDTGYTGYRDDAFVPPQASDNTVVAEKPLPLVNSRNTSYSTPALRDTSSGAVKSWRRSEHRNLWTKGSRGRCFCRFFGCTIMTIIVLFISIVLTLGLWVKPPDITFNGVNFVDAANKVTVANGGFTIPLTLNISVNNPNFFSATFSNISATATYPGTSISVGGGHETNVKFPADTTAFLQFPFTVTYSVSDDTNLVVLKDLANKCGVTGSSSNIVVDYVLKLKIRVVAMISPSFSATASFPCPLTAAEIESLGGGLLGGT